VRAQEQGCRDQIPGVHGYDVGGEQVELFERVVALLQVVGLELAEISCAYPVGCGLDLDAKEVGAVLDADVVGARVSPGLADGEMAQCGLRHELQFHPLAAFFEASESLPMFHVFSFQLSPEELIARAMPIPSCP
jgi:hypothetical protein